MNISQATAILEMVKVDLQISSSAYDAYLGSLVESAETFIQTEGITLDLTSVPDMQIVEMYAAYLYRSRTKDGASTVMPRMLRYALNNRLLTEKAAH